MSMDLEKLLAGAVPSSEKLPPDQEPLRVARDPDPTPTRVGGSWAASWWMEASADEDGYASPGGRQVRFSHLGRPGFPEIDFRPYDFGTNRAGDRGPSLVGHAVSFEFVGPTARSPFLDVQWLLTDNSADPNRGDVLTLDRFSPRTEPGSPAFPNFGTTPTIKSLYGIDSVPAAGLYLTIPQSGAPAQLADPSGDGGLPDGVAGSELVTDRAPIRQLRPESGFEVFRVVEVGDKYLVLDRAKRVSGHFALPPVPSPVLRAVALLRPAAARLAAVPDPTGRRATTYAFVPPSRSLCGDGQAPYQTFTDQDPQSPLPWAGHAAQPLAGLPADYGEAVALPIPRPAGSGRGHLQGRSGETPVELEIGRWGFFLDQGDLPSKGQVLRIHRVERVAGASAWVAGASSSLQDPGLSRVLGFYEVAQVQAGIPPLPTLVILRRVSEFDPETGVAFDAPWDAFWLRGATPDQEIRVEFTVHDPVEVLWSRKSLDLDALESCRLRGLVRPSDAGRSLEVWPGQVAGTSAHRPDRASLGTASAGGRPGTCADPGNLLDLGFRAVFYPARLSASGTLEPDFDRSLPSPSVVLDPSLKEPQEIRVDYDAAVAFLSHPPAPGPGCEVCPDPATLAAPDNPRGEVVLFASFVARSQEPSGPLRVMGAASMGEDPDPCLAGATEAADPYSDRVSFRLTPQRVTVPSYPERTSIDLDAPYDPLALPGSGYVDLLLGSTTDSAPMFRDGRGNRTCTFGYERAGSWGTPPKLRLEGCYGGGVPGTFVDVTSANPALAVLRRTATSPSDPEGRPGTDYRHDLNYGAAARPTGLRFAGSRLRRLSDGSALVQLADPRAASHERLFRDLFSPSLLSGCEVRVVGLNVVEVGAGWSLLGGVRAAVPQTRVSVPDGVSYLFLSGADPCHPRVDLFPLVRPLPGPEDVALARVTAAAGAISEVLRLHLVLRDVDYRFDIFVGKRPDRLAYGEPAPHFETLADAVDYVGELVDPAAGLSGYQVRIRVVGPTQEVRTPIRIPCDGLVIEGVSTLQAGTGAGRSWGVRWDHPSTALIDLMGKKDVVLRDLAFAYNAVAPGTDALPDRVVLTSSPPSNPVRNFVMERVAFYGGDFAHGLAFIPAVAGGFVGARIRDCRTEQVTDFGIYVQSGPSDVQVSGCQLAASATPPQTTLPGLAAVFLGPAVGNDPQSVVSDVFATGFRTGFWADRAPARFSRCSVGESTLEAFVAQNLAEVDMSGCSASAANKAGPSPRAGVRVSGASRFTARSCRVEVAAAAPADLGLLEQGTPQVLVSDFASASNIQVGDGAILRGCTTDAQIQLGKGCAASDCVAATVRAGADCQVSSCQVRGPGMSLLGDRTSARGCHLSDVTVFAGTALADCTLAGQLFSDPSAQYFSFTGCTFGNLPVTLSAPGAAFRGCRFVKSLQLQGSWNVVESCYFTPTNDANLIILPSGGTRFQQCRVQGNILTGLGGIFVDADESLVMGNAVQGSETVSGSGFSIVVSGAQCVVSHNSALTGILVGLSGTNYADCVVSANSVVGDLFCRPVNSALSGNRVNGVLTVQQGCTGSGNVVGSVSATNRAALSGNHVTGGDLAAVGDGMIASGNWVEGRIVLPSGASRSVVSGNRAAELLAKGHTGTAASGNYLDSVNGQLAVSSVYAGNLVEVDLDARATQPTVVGNLLNTGVIHVLRDRSFVVVGNSGPGLDAPPGPGDPDPPGPNKAVVVGNRLGVIFGAPGDGRARTGNSG